MTKYTFLGLIILIVITFMVRLLSLQLNNDEYLRKSENNAVMTVYDYPDRGLIYDRNNTLLASNRLYYNLVVVMEKTRSFDTLTLCKLTDISKEKLKMKMREATRFSVRLPYVIESQISKSKYALLQEKMWQFSGFSITKNSLRDYKIHSAANILGYLSEVNENDLKKDAYYHLGEQIGRRGIEKSYEKYLRGARGEKFFQKDKFNRIIGSYKNGKFDIEPSISKDIYLTIDIELQKYGEEIMKNKRGGIVAIEPSTGEVLSMVSAPSFNPNLLIGRKRNANYKLLANDSIAKPLFDRATQAVYPPGSPFKVVNALIGLQEGVIRPQTTFSCYGGFYYTPYRFMRCHCGQVENNLLSAIYKSCNTFFGKTYTRILDKYPTSSEGMDNWAKYLRSFGLGNYLGYDLPSGQRGLVPTSKYYNRVYGEKKWRTVTTISNAIGQGEILTTPIQLANLTAAIANRGHFYTPHFVKKIDENSIDNRFKKKDIPIDEKHFETVINGMFNVVKNGTARNAQIPGIEVCGKTGTVENFIKLKGKKVQLTDHSIFIAFAPKEDPKIAIAVFIENGYWGARWASPIASLMIEKYLNKTISRKELEDRMLEGSLLEEYAKPFSNKPFTINE